MVKESVNSSNDYDQVIESIQRNQHLLENSNESTFYKFNNRLLLSNNNEFLDAVKSDVGGEIIVDSAIGHFLYFEDKDQD